MKNYNLQKLKSVFRQNFRLYKRKKKKLADSSRSNIQKCLENLQQDILKKNIEVGTTTAKELERLAQTHLKKNFYDHFVDSFLSLVVALIIAVIIRSTCFELYEVPSGSMRPTLKESDRLIVSKTVFGLNIPFIADHFHFDPDLVQRNSTVIFTGQNLDIQDLKTKYFYLFPGVKQFVKRLIGKPGDTLYFYGGKVYGIDAEGNDISKLLEPSILDRIDHVPYMNPEGRVVFPTNARSGIYSPITLKQMNQPLAKLEWATSGRLTGKLLAPFDQEINDYYDLWGFKNFGMTRLLTKKQVRQFSDVSLQDLEEAPLYMEIAHHPSIKNVVMQRDYQGRLLPFIGRSFTLLPLTEAHLKTLFNSLYTARFEVKEGIASPFGMSITEEQAKLICVKLNGIPDGTYEFYYGTPYKVLWGGITQKLPPTHPLAQFNVENLQLFYNLGFNFTVYGEPHAKEQYHFPARYAYYRDGDLYAMGAPLMKKGDPSLTHFIEKEHLKQKAASSYHPYYPFVDFGAPFNEQKELDVAFIKQYGLKVPEKSYLALGDNYAVSADCRDFGFVPEKNLRGSAAFIFWPTGDRFGHPLQTPYPWINTPKLIACSLGLVVLILMRLFYRKHRKLPLKID